MCRAFMVVVLTFFLSSPVIAQNAPKPGPSLTPDQVISLQLEGFKQNDIDGIALAWAFAHPDNKRFTGPLERFALMMNAPNYRILLGHRSAEIKPLQIEDETAIFAVTITGAEDAVVVYQWGLRKVTEGENQGAWMTVTVSPPVGLGKEI
jgi:hypothetical protein